MRNRDAWLAAIAAALGISEEACRRDAAPQVQQVATPASSSVSVVAATAPSASADIAPSATAVASAAPSASASAAVVKPLTSAQTLQELSHAICGAVAQNTLQLNAACGGTAQVLQQMPGNGSCGAMPQNRIPGGGACGGIGAPQQQGTGVRGPTAVIAVTVTGGATGDERVVNVLRPRMRACANQALSQDPSQQGKLLVTVTVAANGDVQKADITNNAGLSAASAQCMLRGVKNATFPAGAVRTLTLAIVQTKQSP